MNFFPPLLLHYYITYHCNCRCPFCDIWHSKPYSNTTNTRVNDVKQNLIQAKKLGVKFVDFTGGEPLLHPKINILLKIAKELGFRTSITTNCLLYPQKAETIKGLVDFLHFSLDSLNKIQHDDLRGKNVFDKVMHSIDTARTLGESPDLLYTVTDQNVEQIIPLSEFAKRLGLILIVNPVFLNGNSHTISFKNLKLLEKYQFKHYVYINRAFHRLRKNGGNRKKNPRCRVVSSTLVISPDNYLLLPCFHFNNKKIVIKNSLLKIYNSQKFKEYKHKQGRFDFCANCVLNCYFDPSFVYKCDAYFFESLQAKVQYIYYKHIKKKFDLLFGRLDYRPALEIVKDIYKE